MDCVSFMVLGLLFDVLQVKTVETSQNGEADLNCPSLLLDFSREAYMADASLRPLLCFSQKEEISSELFSCVYSYVSFYYHLHRENAASMAHTCT